MILGVAGVAFLAGVVLPFVEWPWLDVATPILYFAVFSLVAGRLVGMSAAERASNEPVPD